MEGMAQDRGWWTVGILSNLGFLPRGRRPHPFESGLGASLPCVTAAGCKQTRVWLWAGGFSLWVVRRLCSFHSLLSAGPALSSLQPVCLRGLHMGPPLSSACWPVSGCLCRMGCGVRWPWTGLGRWPGVMGGEPEPLTPPPASRSRRTWPGSSWSAPPSCPTSSPSAPAAQSPTQCWRPCYPSSPATCSACARARKAKRSTAG